MLIMIISLDQNTIVLSMEARRDLYQESTCPNLKRAAVVWTSLSQSSLPLITGDEYAVLTRLVVTCTVFAVVLRNIHYTLHLALDFGGYAVASESPKLIKCNLGNEIDARSGSQKRRELHAPGLAHCNDNFVFPDAIDKCNEWAYPKYFLPIAAIHVLRSAISLLLTVRTRRPPVSFLLALLGEGR